MTATRTQDSHIRTAQLILLWCCVLAYALVCLCNMPFYAESKALAMGTALYRADVSREELSLVLDGVLGVHGLWTSADVSQEDLSDAYRAVAWLSEMDAADLASVGMAWQYPRAADKAPLALLRYASLKDKLAEVAALIDGEETPVRLSGEEWTKSAVQLTKIAGNVKAMGEERILRLSQIVAHIRQSTSVAEDLSVLEMRMLYEGLWDLTEGVNWGDLYAMDFVCGVGFSYAAGEDLTYLMDEMHALDTDRLLDIAMYLPNKARATYHLVHYLFAERAIDATRAATVAVDLQTYGLLPHDIDVVAAKNEIDYLAACSKDPTEEEWQQIAPHVEALWATLAFSLHT